MRTLALGFPHSSLGGKTKQITLKMSNTETCCPVNPRIWTELNAVFRKFCKNRGEFYLCIYLVVLSRLKIFTMMKSQMSQHRNWRGKDLKTQSTRNVSVECNATRMLGLSSAEKALYSRKCKWDGIWRSLPSDSSTFK